MIFRLVALSLFVGSATAFAAGGAHSEGIPSSIWFYVINFLLYVALLVFLLRKPVRNFFANRQTAFKQALVKAEQAKHAAESQKKEIAVRLAKLEASSDSAIAQARSEAEELKSKILQDAEALARNLKEEAQRTAQLEIERAKHELREEMLGEALNVARKILNERMAEPDQIRLQTESVEKIQVVR